MQTHNWLTNEYVGKEKHYNKTTPNEINELFMNITVFSTKMTFTLLKKECKDNLISFKALGRLFQRLLPKNIKLRCPIEELHLYTCIDR